MNCFGCGAKLQNLDQNTLGFVPEKQLTKENPLCKRCFSIKHYSKSTDIKLNTFNPELEIKKINIKNSVIAIVCDIYTLSSIGKIFKQFSNIIKNNHVWLTINKIDLLPKSINLKKIKNNIINNYKKNFRFNDIFLLSSHKKLNIDLFLEKANKICKNIYLIGYTNSGKSSITNAILKSAGADNKELIVKSHIPNTTISKIEIPISPSHKLFDLPGLKSNIEEKLDHQNIKLVNILGEQKTSTFQIESGQKIYIDNVAVIDFISGDKTNFTFYINNKLKLHRTKSSKQNPKFNTILEIKFAKKEFYKLEFKEEKFVDIEIPHIGFIRFKSTNQKIKITSIFTPSVRNTII